MRLLRTGIVAVAFVLALCGTTAAQRTRLVQHDDKDDPCRQFKMRILVPAEASPDPSARRPAFDVDPRMVRNPCPRDEPQLVLMQHVPFPTWSDLVFSPPPFSFPPTSESRRGSRPPGASFSEPTPLFELMRRPRR